MKNDSAGDTAVDRSRAEGLLAASRTMLDNALAGRWDVVGRHYRGRRAALEAVFAAPVAAADVDWMAAILRELLAIEQRLAALGGARRETLAAELRRMGRGRRAQRAYRSFPP